MQLEYVDWFWQVPPVESLYKTNFRELQEGEKLEAFIKPPNSSGMTIKPKILEYKPADKLRWLGVLGVRKLFDGEHSEPQKK